MKTQSRLGLSLALTGLLIGSAQASNFSNMFVFGDSLSDGGSSDSAVISIYKLNSNQCDGYHPCPPYVDGHYTNGSTAVEYLAKQILPGGGSATNFFNFAVSGSTSGIGNFGDGGGQTSAGSYPLPGISQQLGLYQLNAAALPSQNALYVVWGGANDFLTNDSPQQAAKNIAGHVGVLAAMGAENILVPNIPDLSRTPFVQASGQGVIDWAQAFTLGFNGTLADELSKMSGQLPATTIYQFDTYSFFNSLAANPGAYGFNNAIDACVIAFQACNDPDGYVFWDDFHPTTKVHALLASQFASMVPLPGGMVFFASGLAAWMGLIRRRFLKLADA